MESKTVVLDGYTLNPGDLSWEPLTECGHCEIYERTAPHEIVDRAKSAAALLTNKVVLDQPTLEQLPHLRYIGLLSTGVNVVDLAATRTRGIVVSNVPVYGTPSVVQMTLALLLELTQRVGHHAGSVRGGNWSRSKDFSYWDYPLVELSGLTMACSVSGRLRRGPRGWRRRWACAWWQHGAGLARRKCRAWKWWIWTRCSAPAMC